MTMLDETRERFLLAITARVPAGRIAEIHFFPPIRQAGVESGVAVVVEQGVQLADAIAIEPPLADVVPVVPRVVVHTARYRLVLKGADRGKWETSIVAEADAPMVTVDAVVRGVQRRAGDVDDAIRMDGSEARAIVGDTAVG